VFVLIVLCLIKCDIYIYDSVCNNLVSDSDCDSAAMMSAVILSTVATIQGLQ
jgi:hypothetical protein